MPGAPDLEGATQHKRSLRVFTASDHGGRDVHYGIREHAMGAMMNGMAARGGVVPVGVTSLVCSDYLRPTLRLAAMMGLPVPFVFTQDSIGIGRNGPTHRPVDYLASLRAIPNMLVLRPADAVEAAECWEIALNHRAGPFSLIFSRQSCTRCRGRALRSSPRKGRHRGQEAGPTPERERRPREGGEDGADFAAAASRRLRFQPSRPAPSRPHQVPHEHGETAGNRKRRTLWIELPPIDPLENTIGQPESFHRALGPRPDSARTLSTGAPTSS
ncbi:hypothetical protein QA634_14320 [Methylobacterium sp. CB376]|uniref:hypothetical protein n=1 Tax=unclassified Methylobacterium TaxID=2615210 RepID=UPI002240A969|nr:MULTISPECIES: hypothetical protein [Methylobacterium]WFT83573.1 hypothetical protein QA634_14320 [Methylobacterium nodulans]